MASRALAAPGLGLVLFACGCGIIGDTEDEALKLTGAFGLVEPPRADAPPQELTFAGAERIEPLVDALKREYAARGFDDQASIWRFQKDFEALAECPVPEVSVSAMGLPDRLEEDFDSGDEAALAAGRLGPYKCVRNGTASYQNEAPKDAVPGTRCYKRVWVDSVRAGYRILAVNGWANRWTTLYWQPGRRQWNPYSEEEYRLMLTQAAGEADSTRSAGFQETGDYPPEVLRHRERVALERDYRAKVRAAAAAYYLEKLEFTAK